MTTAIVTNVTGENNPNIVIDMTASQFKNNSGGKVIARQSLPAGKYIVFVNVDVWALTLQMDAISMQFPLHYTCTLESNGKAIDQYYGDLLPINNFTNGTVNFHVETSAETDQSLELKFWGNLNNCLVVRGVKVTALKIDELSVLNEKTPIQRNKFFRNLTNLANLLSAFKLVK